VERKRRCSRQRRSQELEETEKNGGKNSSARSREKPKVESRQLSQEGGSSPKKRFTKWGRVSCFDCCSGGKGGERGRERRPGERLERLPFCEIGYEKERRGNLDQRDVQRPRKRDPGSRATPEKTRSDARRLSHPRARKKGVLPAVAKKESLKKAKKKNPKKKTTPQTSLAGGKRKGTTPESDIGGPKGLSGERVDRIPGRSFATRGPHDAPQPGAVGVEHKRAWSDLSAQGGIDLKRVTPVSSEEERTMKWLSLSQRMRVNMI